MTSQTTASLDKLRVDQVGSLLRPAALVAAFERHGAGTLGDAGLAGAQDEAVRAAVARQEAAGLPIVTDGEFRRLNFQDSFALAVSGFAATPDTLQRHVGAEASVEVLTRRESGLDEPGPAITNRRPAVERLKMVRNVPLDEFRFAQSQTQRPVKVAIVGPDRISQRFAYEDSKAVYAGMDEFLADVVAIQRQMIQELVDAGCRYVQIDAPGYTAYVDPPLLARMEARGEDPRANLEQSIEADNAVIAGFPGVTFGIHICRGNDRSRWHREGAYDAIAERLFSGLDHQRLLLEYDDARSGGFEPLRFVRKGTVAVLGLVTTKVGELESQAGLIRRIEQASRFLPLNQLALSPQCGFASGILGNLLSEQQQWSKLERVAKTAEVVWGTVG